ncbi:MAG: tRNA (N(6)-L-threonylcarbamoyladenosine(37)-C(2))-methylthiotransferase [Candidatus Thorarchaeota archaeon]|nr:tRNA (N(6)-L-threonylcarbamoyladenosine(37)-C(2))-methylthiotransferase [Candidatus Thorarchaeota archaeon]
MPIRFYLETYGCSLNSADSDIIIGKLREIDAQPVGSFEQAELIILNTCGVKEPTEDRIIHRLEELSGSTKPVIVTGCLPKISLSRIEKAIPNYAAILGPQAIESMIEIVPKILAGARGISHLDSTDISKLTWLEAPAESVICTIPICEGCLGNCSYCAVKFARGQVKSHLEREICQAIEKCTRDGYREIRITSQDLGAYGFDIDSNLVTLIQKIDEIEGRHKFRLGMFNPNLVSESIGELLQTMKSDHFFKFFHIPLQSGSDSVLKAMGRLYTVEDWESIIRTIRENFNDATIATDIIVGFPGETKDDFDLTLDVIRRIRPTVVNISKYGDRPGTQASKSKNKVETSTKKQRSRRLTMLVNRILLEDNNTWIGWSGPAIVTERGSRSGFLCRNSSYKSIIVHEEADLGSIVNLQVVKAARTHLFGRIISFA